MAPLLVAEYFEVPDVDVRVLLTDLSPILKWGQCYGHAGLTALVDAVLQRLQAELARQQLVQLHAQPVFTMQQISCAEGMFDCCYLWLFLSTSSATKSHGLSVWAHTAELVSGSIIML